MGTITTNLTIAGKTCQHSFVVSDLLQDEFLIGLDYMRKAGIVINTAANTIETPMGQVKFMMEPRNLSRNLKIRSKKTVTLKASSVCLLEGKLETKHGSTNNTLQGEVTPYINLLDNNSVCVFNTVSLAKDGTIIVQATNISDEPVTVYKHKLLAFFEPLDLGTRISNISQCPRSTINNLSSDSEPEPEGSSPPSPNPIPPQGTETESNAWVMEDLFKRLSVNDIQLPADKLDSLKELLRRYQHCFAKDKYDLGKSNMYKAKIELKNDFKPQWVPARPVSYKLQPQLDAEIENLEKHGIIEPCNYSMWNSAIFLVPKKKAGTYRLVIDLRQVNDQCLQDNYELPKLGHVLDELSECKYLSSFDFVSSFTQIEYDEESKHITAFTHRGVRYCWARMVMGHLSSSAQFSRMMARLFIGIPNLLFFVDDLLTGSKTIEEHLQKIELILKTLSQANLKLSPDKCKLFQSEVQFAGFCVSESGIRVDEDRLKAIKNLNPPETRKQLQSVLGTFNYVRKFIKQFAHISRPLYDLLKKDQDFIWNQECQLAFEELKSAMTNPPIMAIPEVKDPENSYEVTIDSSSKGYGATLTQLIRGERKLIAYFSKAAPAYKRKMGATKAEFYGLYEALTHWRMYLEGTTFKIFTDCAALTNFQTLFAKGHATMQRKLEKLSSYRFSIHHIPGKENTVSDFLSRYPFENEQRTQSTQTEEMPPTMDHLIHAVQQEQPTTANVSSSSQEALPLCQETLPQEILISHIDTTPAEEQQEPPEEDYGYVNALTVTKDAPITLEEIKTHQQEDEVLKEVTRWVKKGERPQTIQEIRAPSCLVSYWKQFGSFELKDDILYRNWSRGDNEEQRLLIVVPGSLQEKVMYNFHGAFAANHPGIQISWEKCSEKYYFYKMKEELKLYIQACNICNESKRPQKYFKPHLKPIIYTEFNQCISIDHLVVNIATPRRNKYILTITCHYTNYLVAIPVKTLTSEETVRTIILHWALRFGIFKAIQHDRHQSFSSHLFQGIMDAFRVKDIRSTAYKSSTQGRVEAQNARINTAMRTSVPRDDLRNWDLYLPYVVFILNQIKSTHTGFSSNFLVFGRELNHIRDLWIETPREQEIHPTRASYAFSLHNNLKRINNEVRKNAARQAEKMSKQYNKNANINEPVFKKGDYCYIKIPVPDNKFGERFEGPYEVTSVLNEHLYKVITRKGETVVNVGKMKPYKLNKYSSLANPEIESQTDQPQLQNQSGPKPRQYTHMYEEDDEEDTDDFRLTTNYKHNTRTTRNPKTPQPSPLDNTPRSNLPALGPQQSRLEDVATTVTTTTPPAETSNEKDEQEEELLIPANFFDIEEDDAEHDLEELERMDLEEAQQEASTFHDPTQRLQMPYENTQSLPNLYTDQEPETSTPRYELRPRANEVPRYTGHGYEKQPAAPSKNERPGATGKQKKKKKKFSLFTITEE